MAQGISFKEAAALAKSGDPEAQYALSSVLHQRGELDESLRWLRLSAAQKLIPAQITLATFLIDGRLCPRDRMQAIDLLKPLAGSEVHANILLSELYGFAALGGDDRETALRFLVAAAQGGDAGALRQLALIGVCHRAWPLVRPLLAASSDRGDAAAAYALACCYAEGLGGRPEPAMAAAIGGGAAARRQYLSQRFDRTLVSGAADSAPRALPIDWSLLESTLPALAAELPLPAAQTLNQTPLIRKLPGVVHPLVLDAVINLAAPLVQRSQIIDARTGEARADPMRNSFHVTLGPRQHDHLMESIERCIRGIAGTPPLNSEFLQIIRYRRGEEFRPHVDYFNEGGYGTHRSLAEGGQRAQTVLMYLNDDYGGGNTCFPTLKLEIEVRRGDILHFHNLEPDGQGHKASLHAGRPVTSGEKWLLSQWIRCENYPPRVRW